MPDLLTKKFLDLFSSIPFLFFLAIPTDFQTLLDLLEAILIIGLFLCYFGQVFLYLGENIIEAYPTSLSFNAMNKHS